MQRVTLTYLKRSGKEEEEFVLHFEDEGQEEKVTPKDVFERPWFRATKWAVAAVTAIACSYLASILYALGTPL